MSNATATAPEPAEKIDRDIPRLKTGKKKNNLTRLVLVGGMLVALIVVASGGAMFMERLKQRKLDQNAAKAKERPAETVVVPKDFEATKKRIKAEEAAMLPPPAAAIGVVTNTAPGATDGSPAAGGAGGTPLVAGRAAVRAGGNGLAAGVADARSRSAAQLVESVTERRLSSDVMVPLGGDGTPAAVDRAAGESAPVAGPRERSEPSRSNLDDKLRPSLLAGGIAVQRPNLSLLLRRGTVIDCGQKTAIVSTHPGLVSCVIAKDVYSANGAVLLVERGSEAIGERVEPMARGQTSMMVLWTRIETPRGVVLDINSLGTDPLGATGIPAYVDDHLGQRFGAAVMLSLISDAGQAAVNKAGGSDSTIRLTTTASAGQDLASKALENTINIPPTGYSLQGSAIKIFMARDMDFRSVYELVTY